MENYLLTLKCFLMKKNLLFICLLLGMFSASGQNIWEGDVNNLWSNSANWSLGVVPNSTHDVIIPTGSTVELTSTGNVLSVELQGNAHLILNAVLNLGADSNLGPNTTVTWNSGSITGVLSSNVTLTAEGTVNFETISNKSIYNSLILNNEGTFNFNSI